MIEQEHKEKTLYRLSINWLSRTANRRLMVRLGWLALLMVFIHSFEVIFPRELLREWLAVILESLGHQTTSFDLDPYVLLRVDTALYFITANCTYSKLFFMIVPFWWRFGLRLHTNLVRLTLLAMVVLLVNVVRITLALHFNVLGVSWGMAHTIPDALIHLTSLLVFVLLALRSDRKPETGESAWNI